MSTTKTDRFVLDRFDEHVTELAETWYDGDEASAFRHAAFQIIAPDATLSDDQVIQMTAIDHSGDLEIDGWFIDETAETVFLFQAFGGQTRVPESKVAKFWEAPAELLNQDRIDGTGNQSVKELSLELDSKLIDEYSISMVFASRSGFAPSARQFAASRKETERQLTSLVGSEIACRCSFKLLESRDIAVAFESYKIEFLSDQTDVTLRVHPNWTYSVERSGLRSVRATVAASEVVRVFNDHRFKLFILNPRGPMETAKVNKNIKTTLDSEEGRRNFHLFNNGLCATCDDFILEDETIKITNFQIVNGCQTTVTLSKRDADELDETLVDIKLVVADRGLAEGIASSSNSQTALRARDHTAFEKQQQRLHIDFGRVQPPWYYEIKRGYWSYVLDDKEKARFKTGRRKRHIEVQPLAQASLAFRGFPSIALDRVRLVFQGIRSTEDREWYEKAFPREVKVQQLILPWVVLRFLLKQKPSLRFSNFHMLWLISRVLGERYNVATNRYFSSELSTNLVDRSEDWLPGMFRVVDRACRVGFQRARQIYGRELELRNFFRESGDFSGGPSPKDILWEACCEELSIEVDRSNDPRDLLP